MVRTREGKVPARGQAVELLLLLQPAQAMVRTREGKVPARGQAVPARGQAVELLLLLQPEGVWRMQGAQAKDHHPTAQ